MNFGENEAAAVCRQLNYKYSRKDDKVFIPDYPDYQLENFKCEKNGSNFSDCISDEWKTGFGKCDPKDNAYASVCCSNSSTFGETHDGIFISHCADTWIDAEEICEEKKATIASLNEYKQIIGPIHTPALNSDSDKKVYWTKSFFTPWIWSNGCFKFTTETFEYQEFNLDNNTAQACLQMCSIESQPSSFLLSGQFCRCLPTQSLKSNLDEVLPRWCNRKCFGDTLFFCGSGLSSPDPYWSLYTIASEDTFHKISEPHTNQHKQCAILESSKKLSTENCYKRVGYICGQIFPGKMTLPKLMFFRNSPFYEVYMQEARMKCTNDDSTMRLIGENILKQDVNFSQPFLNLWVDISRVLADAYSIYWDPINTGDKSLWRNLEPRWCRATRQGDIYFSDAITACNTRLRYICSMAGSDGGQTGTSISTTVNPGDGMTTNAIITTGINLKCLKAF
ncbi:uncharacterized protein LOC132731271 isoform X2 [Ruditapes philippinarum]|nr:uncharacterized protein LOC132731271 isoform X2 [Ruditapes philippinarum]